MNQVFIDYIHSKSVYAFFTVYTNVTADPVTPVPEGIYRHSLRVLSVVFFQNTMCY